MSMPLSLTTHDTRFDDPDAATVARILAALDGDRHVLVTLGRSDLTYVQASGSARTGLALEYQEGSIDRHYRSEGGLVPLETATDIFQRYARDDHSWRAALAWEHVPHVPKKIRWYSTWVGYVVILAVVAVLVWLWRGW
jgi:hypothetical protein